MIKRILEISGAARLRVRLRQLVVSRDGEEDVSVPIEDLGVLILSDPAASHTQHVFSECMKRNVAVVISDSRRLPCAAILPLAGHSMHAKILAMQIAATAPAKKRIWREIVRAKIRHQAHVLRRASGKECRPLLAMASLVRGGDEANMEAQAARFYWPRLFGKTFRRNADAAGGANALLNYGYAVVRAATARAIVGAGLHPALGVHHHNQYDALCLADDLMEPLRPAVDWAARRAADENGGECPALSPDVKKRMLEELVRPWRTTDGMCPLTVALHSYAASCRRCLSGEEKTPAIPRLE